MNEPTKRHAGGRWLPGIYRPVDLLAVAAGLMLLGMMVLTFTDVIGRYLFSSPVPATYEIVSLIMPGVIFCALPLTVLRHEHVTVDLLDNFVPRAWVKVQRITVSLITAIALAVVAWRLAVKSSDDLSYGTTTDELWLEIWPFSAAMAVLCGLSALVAVCNIFYRADPSQKRENEPA